MGLKTTFENVKTALELLGHVILRSTTCRLGKHRYKWRTDTLALGEKLSVPICQVYGCKHVNHKMARLDTPADGNNGTFLDPVTGRIMGRGSTRLPGSFR